LTDAKKEGHASASEVINNKKEGKKASKKILGGTCLTQLCAE